jgi:hypothetical protein
MKRIKFTPRIKIALKKHSKHHGAKHMTAMKKLMYKGKSFTAAHNSVKKMYKY